MHQLSARRVAAVLAVGVGLLAACSEAGDDPASTQPVGGDEIRVVDNAFEPANLEVTAGDTVTWAWDARAGHDVVGDDFDSGVQQDGTFTHTFDEPGTYDYACSVHRGMTGRVTVSPR